VNHDRRNKPELLPNLGGKFWFVFGNPATVCLLKETRDGAWMQAVPNGKKLLKTVFLAPRNDGYRLCCFTLKSEVKLCRHATLARKTDQRYPTQLTMRIASNRQALIHLEKM